MPYSGGGCADAEEPDMLHFRTLIATCIAVSRLYT